jgi:hypothetical protein
MATPQKSGIRLQRLRGKRNSPALKEFQAASEEPGGNTRYIQPS